MFLVAIASKLSYKKRRHISGPQQRDVIRSGDTYFKIYVSGS